MCYFYIHRSVPRLPHPKTSLDMWGIAVFQTFRKLFFPCADLTVLHAMISDKVQTATTWTFLKFLFYLQLRTHLYWFLGLIFTSSLKVWVYLFDSDSSECAEHKQCWGCVPGWPADANQQLPFQRRQPCPRRMQCEALIFHGKHWKEELEITSSKLDLILLDCMLGAGRGGEAQQDFLLQM